MTLSDQAKYWVALNQVPYLTPELFYSLVERFGSPEKVWKAPESELNQCDLLRFARGGKNKKGASLSIANSLKKLRLKEDGEKELKRAADFGATIVTLLDDDYPARLREVPTPPPVLYCKGGVAMAKDKWAVAIVGSRKCTGYGSSVAFELARRLSNRGFTIVSGMATGVDTAAHKGALRAGGRTIAVFGNGIDIIFPSDNYSLSRDIEAKGLLLSEFPFGMMGNKVSFPRRNGVISGMTLGTIVVEAGRKSGALITARLAVEQGREIFAVPGDVHTSTCRGPHWLLKHGAYLVESADDVIEILGSPTRQAEMVFDNDLPDGGQKEVYEIVARGPTGFDEICAKLKIETKELTTALMMLEMKGRIRQLPGKIYISTMS